MSNLTGQGVYLKGTKRKRHRKSSHWAAEFGTDAEFQAFVRKLPSAVSGSTRRIVFAHFRTAANSGKGQKPIFSGIPLTWEEHEHQHSIGQYAYMPKEEWERLVEKYLRMWIRSKQC